MTLVDSDLCVRVLGAEVFGLTKREKMKRFGASFCSEIGWLFGESQVDNSRYEPRRNFLEKYLTPAIDGGYVEMTQPDSAHSPTQRYRLTAKGEKTV